MIAASSVITACSSVSTVSRNLRVSCIPLREWDPNRLSLMKWLTFPSETYGETVKMISNSSSSSALLRSCMRAVLSLINSSSAGDVVLLEHQMLIISSSRRYRSLLKSPRFLGTHHPIIIRVLSDQRWGSDASLLSMGALRSPHSMTKLVTMLLSRVSGARFQNWFQNSSW